MSYIDNKLNRLREMLEKGIYQVNIYQNEYIKLVEFFGIRKIEDILNEVLESTDEAVNALKREYEYIVLDEETNTLYGISKWYAKPEKLITLSEWDKNILLRKLAKYQLK